MKNFIKNFLIFFILIWLLGFWYLFSIKQPNTSDSNITNVEDDTIIDQSRLLIRIKRAENDLVGLEIKNKKNELLIQNLRQQANRFVINDFNLKSASDTDKIIPKPSINFEENRRKIFSDVKDISYFLQNQFDTLLNSKQSGNLKETVNFIKENVHDRINVLTAEIYNLSIGDNLGEWRKEQSISLASKVQNEFYELQNPKDCHASKKLVCSLNKACGFGCQMHHVMYCFITAYFTKRTMILDSKSWRYNPKGYEAYFKPVSDSCRDSTDRPVDYNEYKSEIAKSVKMPIIDVLNNKPEFLPLSIPKEYLDSLSKFHGDPFVWWAGQILSFLMRFNSKFEETVQKAKYNLKFESPCVGVHVRRTDKVGTEAAFHDLAEYMTHVKDFFDVYDLKNSKKSTRTVYLATDEVAVLNEARKKYTGYTFLLDEANAKTASLNQRYSPESAQGVILDIYFLSQCDYLVCTLSSQVCRMAYELMQARYPDASWRFRSLDDVYYFGGQNRHNVRAVYDHVPRVDLGEIELKTGDLIVLAGNHWNGYSKGKNSRTEKEGLFPSYKVKDVVQFY